MIWPFSFDASHLAFKMQLKAKTFVKWTTRYQHPQEIAMNQDLLFKNYTSVDPKQFIVSKFRLKPVILISECFVLDAATPTNTHPPHEGRRPFQIPKKAATPTNTHPPYEGRQPETTGDKTTSEPKKPPTPTNTKAARSKVAFRTPTVNCLGKNENPIPTM